jgi:hypothetical protein
MNPPTAKATLAAALFSLAVFTPASLFAFATVPQGAMSYTIAAGSLASPKITVFSVPLRDSVPQFAYNDGTKTGYTGASSGFITSLAAGPVADTQVISVAGAGWDPLQFRNAAQPYALRVMSGTSVGRTVIILANRTEHTSTSVVIGNQSVPLTVAAGDRFEIFPIETLATFFADMVDQNVILKSTSFDTADFVQIHNGSIWQTYFHNGTRWRLQGANLDSNNVVIRPDSAVIFGRRGATPINFTALGTVPSTDIKVVVRNSGVTPISNVFPVNRNLSTFGFQTQAGWASSGTFANADKVQIHNGTLWQTFYHNTQWLQSGLNSNPSVLATRPTIVVKVGSATGSSVYNFPIPYNLSL